MLHLDRHLGALPPRRPGRRRRRRAQLGAMHLPVRARGEKLAGFQTLPGASRRIQAPLDASRRL